MKESLRILIQTWIFLMLTISSVLAQNSVITGKVTDKEQKLSLPGASLVISPGNRYTSSLSNGSFEFLNVPPGSYTLSVTYIGFKPFSQEIVVTSGKTTSLNVELEGASIMGKEIVISDRLRGQARALNQQKTNSNISNIVSADQIGRFPDANIGDAMKRIPGITMQNDQGEARDIIIRGLAPELNSVSLNGDRIPSAEGDNRKVQMDLIPSDMIQTIEVNKTLTPDMDADAIGGSVNLVTRAAPNGLRLSGTLSSGYNPIRSKALYTGSFIGGNRFINNRLGLILSGSYNDNDYGSDDIEASWKEKNGKVFIEEQEVRQYYVQRIRRSVSLASDFKINSRNTLSMNSMYNWRDDRENRYRLRYTNIEPSGNEFIGSIQRETKGGIGNDRNKDRRLEDQRVQNYSLRGDHLLSPVVDLDWALSYSSARELRPNERYINFEAEDQVVDLNLMNPQRPFASGTTDLTDFELDEITENRNFTKEKETGARINVRFPLNIISDQKGRLRAGARLRLKDKERINNFFEYSPLGSNQNGFENLAIVPTRYFNGKGYIPGSQYVQGTFADAAFLGGLQLNNLSLFEAEDKPDEYAAINYNAKEAITAGYLRLDQDFSARLSGIFGVRLENTSVEYTGNVVEDEEDITGKRSTKNSYLNVLPSATLKFKANDNFILRLAATTSIARPNYYDLAPYFDIRPGDEEFFAGNETLKSVYSSNFDFMAENYFKSIGLISGGLFYKNIKDFIYRYRSNSYTSSNFNEDFPGVANPVPASENWTFIQPRNGDNVQVYGFELAVQRRLDFLPGFLKGFSIYANYTLTRSEADGIFNEDGEERNDAKFSGTAPNMFNFSLSYETKRFSSRISANYTDSYVFELGEKAFDDIYYDSQFFLDANASYCINKKLRIFAEANNLTNQPLRFYQGIKDRTLQEEFYRPRYNAGLKFDF